MKKWKDLEQHQKWIKIESEWNSMNQKVFIKNLNERPNEFYIGCASLSKYETSCNNNNNILCEQNNESGTWKIKFARNWQ